eukprot:3242191-Rhodomonas_salina.1
MELFLSPLELLRREAESEEKQRAVEGCRERAVKGKGNAVSTMKFEATSVLLHFCTSLFLSPLEISCAESAGEFLRRRAENERGQREGGRGNEVSTMKFEA